MSTPYIKIKQKSLFRYYATAGRNKLFMLKQHVLKRLYIDRIISVDTPAIAISIYQLRNKADIRRKNSHAVVFQKCACWFVKHMLHTMQKAF